MVEKQSRWLVGFMEDRVGAKAQDIGIPIAPPRHTAIPAFGPPKKSFQRIVRARDRGIIKAGKQMMPTIAKPGSNLLDEGLMLRSGDLLQVSNEAPQPPMRLPRRFGPEGLWSEVVGDLPQPLLLLVESQIFLLMVGMAMSEKEQTVYIRMPLFC